MVLVCVCVCATPPPPPPPPTPEYLAPCPPTRLLDPRALAGRAQVVEEKEGNAARLLRVEDIACGVEHTHHRRWAEAGGASGSMVCGRPLAQLGGRLEKQGARGSASHGKAAGMARRLHRGTRRPGLRAGCAAPGSLPQCNVLRAASILFNMFSTPLHPPTCSSASAVCSPRLKLPSRSTRPTYKQGCQESACWCRSNDSDWEQAAGGLGGDRARRDRQRALQLPLIRRAVQPRDGAAWGAAS